MNTVCGGRSVEVLVGAQQKRQRHKQKVWGVYSGWTYRICTFEDKHVGRHRTCTGKGVSARE